eukprot:gnl/TRDRNA2_/TRDRNA2_133095_c0_seq2.p1 gnl/TRDRNA2_/TRDRNA2_133095_c0~~gnl/TRDRNA2_/TRDRNA2_133095_c0_seq2.p1  ORF type:complete len:274 (+),score=35.53 gnl/TRDRNA2_/TRDRNA2_133095_c0_seq2:94-822(+)
MADAAPADALSEAAATALAAAVAAAPAASTAPHLQGPYLDPATGRYYYCNMQTMQSEWAPEQPAVTAQLQMALQMQMPMQYAAHPVGSQQAALVTQYGSAANAAYAQAAGLLQAYAAATPGAYAAVMPGAVPGGGRNRGPDGREQCGDFRRGLCSRGASCKYSHLDAAGNPLQQPANAIGRETCADFKRGTCTRGASCKYVHAGVDGANGSAATGKKNDDGSNPGFKRNSAAVAGRSRSRSR